MCCLATASAAASLVNSVPVRGVELPAGVNRFEGGTPERRLGNARKAYDHITLTSNRNPRQEGGWELGAAGATREKCIEMLNTLRTGWPETGGAP